MRRQNPTGSAPARAPLELFPQLRFNLLGRRHSILSRVGHPEDILDDATVAIYLVEIVVANQIHDVVISWVSLWWPFSPTISSLVSLITESGAIGAHEHQVQRVAPDALATTPMAFEGTRLAVQEIIHVVPDVADTTLEHCLHPLLA